MTSTKNFLDYVLERLSLVPNMTYTKENSDYILSSNGTIFGGIYEDMFLVKITKRSALMIPYAKKIKVSETEEMLNMNELGNKIVLKELIQAIVDDLKVN